MLARIEWSDTAQTVYAWFRLRVGGVSSCQRDAAACAVRKYERAQRPTFGNLGQRIETPNRLFPPEPLNTFGFGDANSRKGKRLQAAPPVRH